MLPGPQQPSRFVEGSMNDRASAAPPPDFLGDGTTADFERQFAMDWKPPELQFGGDSIHANRNSFMSAHSAAPSLWPKTPRSSASGSGFFSRVGEKFGLHRSRSSVSVGVDDDSERDSNENSTGSAFSVPPVFKQARSESMSVGMDSSSSRAADFSFLKRDADAAKSRKTTAAAEGPHVNGGVADAAAAASPLAPGLDPSKRPTREEITANYQSLLASGFFGTHAIQSTRFAAPGQKLHHQNRQGLPSFAQRLAQDGELQRQDFNLPPRPERLPPLPPTPDHISASPPPPARLPPPPPTQPTNGTSSSSSSSPSLAFSLGIPASSTVIFNPAPSERTSSKTSDSRPPLSHTNKFSHKPTLSFSAVPYSATRPGQEPSLIRPYRPPPAALARFSLESGRRSFDFQRIRDNNLNKGIKRSFATSLNGSRSSFSTEGTADHAIDYHDTDIAMGTADEPQESGARKLVKKLRKSASRISIDIGKTISRQSSSKFHEEDRDNEGVFAGAPRSSLSSTVRRSFSWRLGNPGGSSTAMEQQQQQVDYGNHATGSVLNNDTHRATSTTHLQPSVPRPIPTSLSVIMDSPESNTERKLLKRREIRGRRMRRKEEQRPSTPAKLPNSPLKQSTTPVLAPPDANMVSTVDWHASTIRPVSSPTRRSRSRPRRSEISIIMHSQMRPAMAHSLDQGVVMAPSSSTNPISKAATAAPEGDMEGVEFAMPSFHFPGRVKGPLAVVPDANRGIPIVPSIPGEFKEGRRVEDEGWSSEPEEMEL